MPGYFNPAPTDNGGEVSTKASDKVALFAVNEGTPPTPPSTLPAEPPQGTAMGAAVLGVTKVPKAAGVFGANDSTYDERGARYGVGVQGNGPEAGVSGFSANGVGVRAYSESTMLPAVLGVNTSGAWEGSHDPARGGGVLGSTKVPYAAGVYGANESTFVWDGKARGVGVYGRGPESGLQGYSDSGNGTLTQSISGSGVLSTSRYGQAITAYSDNDVAIYANGATFAGVFHGTIVINKGPNPQDEKIKPTVTNGSIVVTEGNLFMQQGHVFVEKGDVILGGADCAEDFSLAKSAICEPGSVMVLNSNGVLEACAKAYDSRVIGVISGAGDFKPAIVLDRQSNLSNRAPIALVGKVFCKVDATYGAIEAGDLLTTSPTPGHAMKVRDRNLATGAVLGKALARLDTGTGAVPILVTLQ
jgi:hypothetical protein